MNNITNFNEKCKMRQNMYIRLLIILINLTIISFASYAEDEITEADREAIEYLKGLKLEQLVEVEVTLDHVFNIFDGLIKARKVTIDRAPSVTSVITAQYIEATGATDLDEVLEMVPGLHVARHNFAYMPIYIIRGIYSNFNPQVLMLVNGIPINRLYFGNKGAVWGGYAASGYCSYRSDTWTGFCGFWG
jgi:outer membrane receptor for Fe3+-dicitrate